jgi:hypothetical protein
MKKILIFSISLLAISACSKDEALTPVTQTPPVNIDTTKPPESTGTFTGGGNYQTSGTVKVLVDKNDATKKFLSFENFKTSNGPDLYVYLAEDKVITGGISLIKLDKTGTFTVAIPASANVSKQKFVLIWCRQFSALFGSAKLE